MWDVEQVYIEYMPQVYKYLFSLCQKEDLAEELTQEVFCQALKYIDGFREECSLFVWLCQIGKHLWIREMKKRNFVRWRLPKPEADEVLADYEALFSEHLLENDDAWIQDLGEPLEAARLLTEPKVYRRWLAAFGLMASCLLLPEYLLLRARFNQYPLGLMSILLAAGTAIALICFRPQRKETARAPFPKGLCLMLSVLLLIMAAAAAVLAGLITGIWELLPPAWYGRIAYWTMGISGTAAAVTGWFGLVKARMSDRRWRALYIMGLMVLVECVLVIANLVSMDLGSTTSGWWVSCAVSLSAIGLAGLAGAGVSLC